MKKLLSVLLATVLLLTCIPLGAIPVLAEESAPEQAMPMSEEEYIYYSDLFYGYSSYLMHAPVILEHKTDTQYILNKVYEEYRDSPSFAFSNIKDALGATFDLKAWTQKVTDMFGFTSFTYEKALDAANVDLATHMLGGSSVANYYGAEAKWIKKFNDILKVYDTFDQNYDVSVMSETQVFTAMLAVLDDSSVLVYISSTQIQTLTEDILPHISSITKKLSKIGDVLTAAKTIATGIMLEDFRLEMINAILKNTKSGTMLYDGMSRLKNQMQKGFVTYFLENYVKEEVLNSLADGVVKKLTKSLLGNMAGLYQVIGAVTKVASWIVFDCIFHVPDIDDLTKQMVLSEYAYNLYDALETQAGKFSAPFTTQDVTNFETIATAYVAATNAALAASDAVKLSSNKARLAEITKKYSADGFYDSWMENVKAVIQLKPYDQRTITDFGTWTLKGATTMRMASDTIENGCLYGPGNKFKGNITGSYTLTIPADVSVTIDGGVSSVSVINNGTFHITGNLSNCNITNKGLLDVDGNVTSSGNSYDLYQKVTGAELRVGGNFSWYFTSHCQITAGKVVFDGKKQQTVSNFKAKNIEVTNLAGIKYLSSVYLYGEYKLNGNPLDNNGYYTYLYNGCSFADGSDYGNLYIYQSMELTTNVKGNVVNGSSLTIPADVSVTIDGGVSSVSVTNNGTLHITGSLSNCNITNKGLLDVDGNVTSSGNSYDLYQKVTGAELRVGGNFSWYFTSHCQITAGKVVFDGKKQQTVSNFKAPTIILKNKSKDGVVFQSSISPSVLFDHRGNNFTLCNNGSGSTFVDYDGDSLKDNVDPQPTACNHVYSEYSDAECDVCGYFRDLAKVTSQPKSVCANLGDTVEITFEAIGKDLTYQWYYAKPDKPNLFYKTSFGSGNCYSVELTEERVGYRVYCQVTDVYGNVDTTEVVTLTLLPHDFDSSADAECNKCSYTRGLATITRQPHSVCANVGDTAEITFEATGDGLTYQWYYAKPDKPNQFYKTSYGSGNYYSVELTEARVGYRVYCQITDAYGNVVTTDVVTLTLLPHVYDNACDADCNVCGGLRTPSDHVYDDTIDVECNVCGYIRQFAQITSQPKSVCVSVGDTVEITFEAIGDGLTYQWYYAKPDKPNRFYETSYGAGNCYSIELTDDRVGYRVYCQITDAYGNVATTDVVTMNGLPHIHDNACDADCNVCGELREIGDHVYDSSADADCNECGYIRGLAQITRQPKSVCANLGDTIEITFEATGDGLAYQWYYAKPDKPTLFYKTSYGTGNCYSLELTEERVGYLVYCQITDAYGNVAATEVVTLNLLPHDYDNSTDADCNGCGFTRGLATIIRQPKSVCANLGDTIEITFEATGDGLTYQWYYAKPDKPNRFYETAYGSGNYYSVELTEDRVGYWVYCQIADAYGNVVTTDVVTLSLLPHVYDNACDADCNVCGDLRTPSDHVYDNAIDVECNVCGNIREFAQITRQPQSVCANLGDTVEITFEAIGDGLTYQWYYAKPDKPTLFYETSYGSGNRYSIELTDARAGYRVYCQITDAYGNVATTNIVTMNGLPHIYDNACDADCNVCGELREIGDHVYDSSADADCNECGFTRGLAQITRQPKSVCANLGDTIEITFEATGDGLTYQWYYAKPDKPTLFFETSYGSGNGYSVELTEERVGYLVYCQVTDAYGNVACTDVVILNGLPHVYDNAYDVDCNVCGEIRLADVLSGGQYSISEDVNGLAFKFDVVAAGGQAVNRTEYVSGSADVIPGVDGQVYKLVRMGAVVTNQRDAVLDLDHVQGDLIVNVEGKYLFTFDENTLSFAVRIINIPEIGKDTVVYARPYYVYEKDGEEIVIYGDTESNSYNAVLNG